ncbi:hypothetical protein L1987_12345 [Smallanthus sonchifolius]|uniref:Uncharacterized protein n=1 Tax=Smallanthus sonchifolius TaxID=185202 RepID=A0ACB9JE23_9ASTR|nr:hypothetical protein L1987_12345 [Smallanthus sonchifolius]
MIIAGKLGDAKEVTSNMWGPSKPERSIEQFQHVLKNDGGELSIWSELLEEPHSECVINDRESCFIRV